MAHEILSGTIAFGTPEPRSHSLVSDGPAFSPDVTALAASVIDGTVWQSNLVEPSDPAWTATLTGPAGPAPRWYRASEPVRAKRSGRPDRPPRGRLASRERFVAFRVTSKGWG